MQRRNGYRVGRKGVQVWLSLALYGQLRASAEQGGVSLQDWLVEAVREKVVGGGGVGVGAGGGGFVAADGCGSGPVAFGGRGDSGGVGAGDAVRVIPDWDAILAAGRRPLTVVESEWADPAEGIA